MTEQRRLCRFPTWGIRNDIITGDVVRVSRFRGVVVCGASIWAKPHTGNHTQGPEQSLRVYQNLVTNHAVVLD